MSYTYDQSINLPRTDFQNFSPGADGLIDGIDRNTVVEEVKKQIDYDCLMSFKDDSVVKMVEEIKDLMVDRTAYDKIMQAGGYVSVRTGAPQDANAILIPKPIADEAMDAASCIGCGACVAACKNGSAMLFVSAKVSQLNLLPQGKPEALRRAKAMLSKMDELGFGNCTNTRACEAECPKNISISNIARLNRDFIIAKLKD